MNHELYRHQLSNGQEVVIVQGDITAESVDAIVNAANGHLRHGGGVAGAIVRRGGYSIQQESDAWVREHGPLAVGEATITNAGALPSHYVIHTVGPVYGSGDEDAKLRQAVRSALQLADARDLHTVSLPAISSGIFGFPKERAAFLILDEVVRYLESKKGSLQEVRLCNIDSYTAKLFVAAAKQRWESVKDG